MRPVADLRRRPEGAMAPLRKKTAIKKVHKFLLEHAKITVLSEHDLELYQKVQKLLGPLRKTA